MACIRQSFWEQVKVERNAIQKTRASGGVVEMFATTAVEGCGSVIVPQSLRVVIFSSALEMVNLAIMSKLRHCCMYGSVGYCGQVAVQRRKIRCTR